MNQVTAITLATGALLVSLLPTTHAADPANGQTLHDGNCVRCHDSQVYTRPDRRVTDLQALSVQVRRCDSALGTSWFDDEIDDVVQYLSTKYYKF